MVVRRGRNRGRGRDNRCCPECGWPLIFRPWFTDRKGIKHYAFTRGLAVFVWCRNRCRINRA